jgi:hypothetical protein
MAKLPGALVALVDESGTVRVLFRLRNIIEGQSVIAADGSRCEKGAVLLARSGSARRPGRNDPKRLPVNRHALGAFRYFDERSLEVRFYEPPGKREDDDKNGLAKSARIPGPPRRAYQADTLGEILKQPERDLVRRYVEWVGREDRFEHHYLAGSGLHTDLFFRPNWILIEAKSSADRWAIRLAIGQLLDYQRHYSRSPRLAMLLPEKPSPSMIELLKAKRIVAIWKTAHDRFYDSDDGFLTRWLRDT